MKDFGQDEIKVLSCLIHGENMESVIKETQFHPKVVLDILRTMTHYGFAKRVDGNNKSIAMYDVDKLHEIKFMITAKGYAVLEKNSFE